GVGWGGVCLFKLPFSFTNSEGGLAAMKAVYQEMLEIGGYPEHVMKGQKELIESYGDSYQKFRAGYYEKARREIEQRKRQ
ncbi:MAG: hypothetical protein FWF41_00005, partial [Betaproteobacteria bacterium]|nr:hypothetical protein [Betaproteobacteria bacterium]